MATDVSQVRRGVFYEQQDPSLMVSNGNPPKPGKNYPERLDYFRAKPGGDGKWTGAATAFNEHYGCDVEQLASKDGPVWVAKTGPKQLIVRFPSDRLEDVLSVQYLAFAAGRLAAKGDTNYVNVPAWQHYEPEWVTAYPIEGDPVRFQITGQDDPLCLGGSHGIPTEKTGKPTLKIHATLSFTLAEIGSLTAVTKYQTGSAKVYSGFWHTLQRISTLGPLSEFLFILAGKPGTRRYKDDKGVSHTTKTWDPYITGPIHSLSDRRPISISDVADRARLATASTPLLAAASVTSPTPTGAPVEPLPPGVAPGEGWAGDATTVEDGVIVDEYPEDSL